MAPGFEESEALTITDIIRRAQLGCDLVGLWNEIVEGAHGITVKCDRTLQQVMKEEDVYDMVILPGGNPQRTVSGKKCGG